MWFWLSERITFIVIACEKKKELNYCIPSAIREFKRKKNTLDYNIFLSITAEYKKRKTISTFIEVNFIHFFFNFKDNDD